MNKWLFFILVFVAIPHLSWGQDKKIDQLEVLYSQQHYTKVIRKSNKLLAIPDYDYSGMPTFYKSLAQFQLLANEDWVKKHKTGLKDAVSLYQSFLSHSKSDIYIKSHYFEIAELKQFLIDLEKWYRSANKITEATVLDTFIHKELQSITPHGINIGAPIRTKGDKPSKTESETARIRTTDNHKRSDYVEIRSELVTYAMQYIGTPYQWAGNSPKGFDCSGYIGYVFSNYGISLPRSAADLKAHSESIKEKDAKQGDLVFFKTGHKITHVGLIISEQGAPLKMVHSSTSRGIIITDIETSKYWREKYAGVGRIIP
ncbi:MAG: C40 family peptidase [Putridiphycobacter sp.]|nr:C40 family peptidase [Putridiphycobacter sp.]